MEVFIVHSTGSFHPSFQNAVQVDYTQHFSTSTFYYKLRPPGKLVVSKNPPDCIPRKDISVLSFTDKPLVVVHKYHGLRFF